MSAVEPGYVALLRLRGARPLLLWVSLARLQYSVLPLAFLLLLAERRDSFAEAGAAVAVYGLAAGLLGPARARLADCVGPRRTLAVLAVLLALALTGVTLAARASFPVMLGFALLAGCTPPPVGPLMRTAWRHLTGGDQDVLRRAYSLDAVSEEVLYVLGPLVAAAAVAWLNAPSVLLASAAALVVAALGMAASLPEPQLRWEDVTDEKAVRRPPLWRNARFLAGMAPVAGLGFLLGGLEIAAVAAALAAASSSVAGVPAAALSAGSVVGGLLYGRRGWPGSYGTQVRLLACSAAGMVALAALFTSVFGLLVGVLAVAGLCIAPAIVCSYLIADESFPVASNEATAWVNASFNACLALGSAAAGVLVEAGSPRLAMLLVAGAASVVVLLPGLPWPWRAGPRSARPPIHR